MSTGVIAGYPIVDLKVTLVDGSYHEVDSSEMAFKIAGSMALQAGAKKASPQILEPIMACEVVTPKDFILLIYKAACFCSSFIVLINDRL